MTKRIIASEASIQVELKQSITKNFAEKVKELFNPVKNLVNDIDKNISILLEEKDIVLVTKLSEIASLQEIVDCCGKMEVIMKQVKEFVIKTTLDERKAAEPKDEKELDTKKAICDAFNSLKKAIPNAGVFIMVFDPDESGAHLAGDLKKNFVLSTLLVNND